MVTDPVPRTATRREIYSRSDAMRAMPLPPTAALQERARRIETALRSGTPRQVEETCNDLAALVARSFAVSAPPVAVLGVRPHKVDKNSGSCVYEKFGDYTFATTRIRLWMRTAIQERVTSYGCLLSTLTHEICHHLDCVKLDFPNTPHTRGFYQRAALLYHEAKGTPLRPLVWKKMSNGTYRIDWGSTMKTPAGR